MSEHKLGKEGKMARFKLWLQRVLRIQQATSQRSFRKVPGKPRYSTRGEQHPSYYTKAHTKSRRRDLREDRERRARHLAQQQETA